MNDRITFAIIVITITHGGSKKKVAKSSPIEDEGVGWRAKYKWALLIDHQQSYLN